MACGCICEHTPSLIIENIAVIRSAGIIVKEFNRKGFVKSVKLKCTVVFNNCHANQVVN